MSGYKLLWSQPILRLGISASSQHSKQRLRPHPSQYVSCFSTITIKNSLKQVDTDKSPGSDRQESHLSDNSSITWYSCGPTVYDVAHLGHARTYVCTDIIRRILTNYFHVNIRYALGITDIDDKIITKANALQDEMGLNISEAMKITSNKYEIEFFRDMDALNVTKPDAILRVTDHIDDIVNYIKGIESAGCAYVTSNGVYFDIKAFIDRNHTYGKIDGNIPPESLTGGESDEETSLKRNSRDFVLWKFSKENEPKWPSPWGDGRPGWHIECSAMTHSFFGKEIDIHSGGIDLKFPHHTNEVAQCEAHNNNQSWVRIWLHTGHLYIQGLKMSKSLKNFISIQDYLSSPLAGEYAADDFRIFCLQHKYHAPVHFSEDRIYEARTARFKYEHLFSRIKAIKRGYESDNTTKGNYNRKPTQESVVLLKKLSDIKFGITKELRNDFNTPEAFRLIISLVREGMVYSQLLLDSGTLLLDNHPNNDAIKRIHPIEPILALESYILEMLNMFGIDVNKYVKANSSSKYSHESNESDAKTDQALNALIDFRSLVRLSTRKNIKNIRSIKNEIDEINSEKSTKLSTSLDELSDNLNCVLKSCDNIRDKLAPELNIRIEDTSEKSTWRKIT